MIRVTVDLISALGPSRNRNLGVMTIINTGEIPGLEATRGNYVVQIYRKGTNRVQRQGRVINFPKKAKTIWYLLQEALKNTLC